MADLSPAAQSILNVYYKSSYIKSGLAAVIRELADQAHPTKHIKDISYTHQNYVDGWKDALDAILAIATEIKGTND